MHDTSLAIETLNDLILINNDRITGYEKAAHQAKDLDPEIKNVFHHMASESRKNVLDLHAEVHHHLRQTLPCLDGFQNQFYRYGQSQPARIL